MQLSVQFSSSSASAGGSTSSGSIVQSTMVGVDLTMTMFHGVGNEDLEKHLLVCKPIWIAKQVQDEATKISQLEETFRDRALTWYMKFKSVTLVGQMTLNEIKQPLIREFHKPKS